MKCCVNCGNNSFYESYEDYLLTTLKYCANCGRANTENYNCCPECGSSDFVDYEKHLKLQKAKAKGSLGKRLFSPIGKLFTAIGGGFLWFFKLIASPFTALSEAIKDRPSLVLVLACEIASIVGLITSIVLYVITQNAYALGGIVGSSASMSLSIYGFITNNSCKNNHGKVSALCNNLYLVITAAALVAFIVLMCISRSTAICGLLLVVCLAISDFVNYIALNNDASGLFVGCLICIFIAVFVIGYGYGF